MGRKYTRRQFLGAASAGVGGIALLGLTACESAESGSQPDAARADGEAASRQEGVQYFRSRPDLMMPEVEVLKSSAAAASGYLITAAKNGIGEEHPSQHGPMILDGEDASPVWLRPIAEAEVDAMDFRVQSYRGEPVLSWWEGTHGGWGQGEYVILDSSYREVTRLGAVGYEGDHHEFLITDRDTALIGIYSEEPADLSPLGGPARATVMEGIIQEIDIATGELLFEWRSLDHVGADESYYEISPEVEQPFDYFHINSIEVDADENLLVSARRTCAVYKIDRESGELIWRLGGKKSDFEMTEGTRFFYQHDARRQPDGSVTLFDNRGEGTGQTSRGIALDLDEQTMQASLLREYVHPDDIFGIFQGNLQRLPNDNVFIGWGSAPHLSEFSRDGEMIFDATFPEEAESYRSYRSPWKGLPEEEPAIAIEAADDAGLTVYASYNGATELYEWEVLAGPGPDELSPLNTFRRKGFETAMSVQTGEQYLGVRAKNRSGETLGSVSERRD